MLVYQRVLYQEFGKFDVYWFGVGSISGMDLKITGLQCSCEFVLATLSGFILWGLKWEWPTDNPTKKHTRWWLRHPKKVWKSTGIIFSVKDVDEKWGVTHFEATIRISKDIQKEKSSSVLGSRETSCGPYIFREAMFLAAVLPEQPHLRRGWFLDVISEKRSVQTWGTTQKADWMVEQKHTKTIRWAMSTYDVQ